MSAADEPAAVEVEDRELAVVERAAHDLAVPLRSPGPTYSSVAQSARSDQKYGHLVVGPPARRASRAAAAAPWARGDLPVLDPQPAAVHDRVVLARVARRPDARRRRLAASASSARRRVSPSSSPAERASITSGTAPVPITTRSASSSSRPDSVTTRCDARRRPRSAPSASPVDELDRRARAARSAKNAPAAAPKPRRQRRVLEHHQRAALAHARSATPRPRRRCRSRRSARRARRPRRRRGSRPRCRARAGSGCPRARRRRRAAGARSRRWRAARAPKPTLLLGARASPSRAAGVELHHARAREQLDAVLGVPVGRVQVGVLARRSRRAGSPWSTGGRS